MPIKLPRKAALLRQQPDSVRVMCPDKTCRLVQNLPDNLRCSRCGRDLTPWEPIFIGPALGPVSLPLLEPTLVERWCRAEVERCSAFKIKSARVRVKEMQLLLVIQKHLSRLPDHARAELAYGLEQFEDLLTETEIK